MERFSYDGHAKTLVLLAALHLAEDLKLDVEELFELHSLACFLHGYLVSRKMDIRQSFGERHKVLLLNKVDAECFAYTALA